VSKKNIDYFPAGIAKKLSSKQMRVIGQYETVTKLRAVMRWKERMARHGISNIQIARDVGVATPRISEYLNFQRQPHESKFRKIESAIYKRGA